MVSEKSCGRWRRGPNDRRRRSSRVSVERFVLSIALTSTLLPSTARAETKARIQTAVTPHCATPARDLEQRLAEALGRSSSHRLDVSVAIEREGVGYRVTLVTRDQSSVLREKRILAPTCEEAMDAAVVVLALAASETAAVKSSDPMAVTETAIAPAGVVEREPAPLRRDVVRAPKDEGATPIESAASSTPSSRASLSTGIDAGTLPSATLVLSGAFARSFSEVEVRALARYGLPSVNETTETGFYASERRDFGALELRACYGVGAEVRLLACTGGELGAVRVARRVEEGGTDVDEDAVSPRLSGVLAALVRHQGGAIQPELEVSGSALGIGKAESASWLALRVSAGAAVEF